MRCSPRRISPAFSIPLPLPTFLNLHGTTTTTQGPLLESHNKGKQVNTHTSRDTNFQKNPDKVDRVALNRGFHLRPPLKLSSLPPHKAFGHQQVPLHRAAWAQTLPSPPLRTTQLRILDMDSFKILASWNNLSGRILTHKGLLILHPFHCLR